MRTFHEVRESVETYSPSEERFNRRRQTAGLVLAPLLLVSLLAAPLPVPLPAHRMAGVLGMVVVLWITEALPLSVTALLGPVLAVVLGVVPARTALAPFADPIIFLFIGAFILAEAMFVHGLDRRVAYTALSWKFVGARPGRALIVYGGVAALLSMWISNTATTAMLFPIGLSLIAHMSRNSRGRGVEGFAMAMMLITTFGASIGGVATPVGTPPNLIGIGMIERITGADIGFFNWMALGVPAALALFAGVAFMFYVLAVRGVELGEGSAAAVRDELRQLGRLSRGERNVLVAFGTTVVLWIAPGMFALAGVDQTPLARAYAQAMPEGVAAIVGAVMLFLLPVEWRSRRFTITWEQAARIDWGIVMLYGGGLALGELSFSTGLADAMGRGITSWLPSHSTASLTILFTGAAILLSETTSNTAAANMIVPVAIAVAQASNVRAIEPALGATLGASMGFMMPVSTPTNAIVYSSGYVPIGQMIRYGVILDVLGFFVIVAIVLGLAPLVM